MRIFHVKFRKKNRPPEYDEPIVEINATVEIFKQQTRLWFEHPCYHHPVDDVLSCLNWIEDEFDWGTQCRYEELIYAIDSWIASEGMQKLTQYKNNDIIEV